MNILRPGGFLDMGPVTKNLLILNGLFYLTTMLLYSQGIDLVQLFGMHIPGSSAFKIWQPVTHMFMHSQNGPWHLIFNMIVLWFIGAFLEQIWGSRRFLNFYLIAGFGAVAIHYLYVYLIDLRPILSQLDVAIQGYGPEQIAEAERYKDEILSQRNIIGASGAIAGLFMAYAYLFPNSEIYFYFLIPVKAKYLAAGFLVYEIWQTIQYNPYDNVAHMAHIGGMIIGYFMVRFVFNQHPTSLY